MISPGCSTPGSANSGAVRVSRRIAGVAIAAATTVAIAGVEREGRRSLIGGGRERSVRAALRRRRGRGTTSGAPRLGVLDHPAREPEDLLDQLGVTISRRVALGDDRAVAHRDQVGGVAAGVVEVVQHRDQRAAAARCRSAQRSSTSIWWAMSRKVVGSSSSRIGVSWASAIAIQTRWRWPPDSSSTSRSASVGRRAVAAIAAATARSSSRDHWRSSLWCG